MAADALIQQSQQDRAQSFPDQVTIPVSFVVFYKSSGEGNVPFSRLQAQVNQFNDAFSAGEAKRDKYSGATDAQIRFTLHSAQYYLNDDYHDNCALYNYQQIIKPQYSLNPAKYYYIYICHCTSALGLSWEPYMTYLGKPVTESHWIMGSIIHWDLLPGSGLFSGRWNQGDIATHESGHFLGLRHLYDGGCTGPDSMTDGIADTPRQVGNTFNADCKAKIDTCPTLPGKDDNSNYMGIFKDSCRDHFTPGQVAYMQATMITYKPTMLRQTTPDCVAAVDNTDASPDLMPCVGSVQTDTASGKAYCITSAKNSAQWAWACCASDGTACRQGTVNLNANLAAVRSKTPSSSPPTTSPPPASSESSCTSWKVSGVGTKCQMPFKAKRGSKTRKFTVPATVGQFRPAGSAGLASTVLWCPFQGVTNYITKNKKTKKLWGQAVCDTSSSG